MTTIALAIPHCPWDVSRVKSLERLRQQLGITNTQDEHMHLAALRIFAEIGPTPNWVWSEKLFQWGAEQSADWIMQVQDDVLPCPDFWIAGRAALDAVQAAGGEAVNLFTIHPHAAALAAQGCNWYTTTDWMVGPCWAVRTSLMREFVDFRSNRLRDGWKERIRENGLNEDTLLGLGCAALGKRIWSPLPALVEHDTGLPSHHGNQNHPFARSSLSWERWAKNTKNSLIDLRDPAFWIPRNPIQGSRDVALHMGCAYSFTPWNMARWVKDDGRPFGGKSWEARVDAIRSDITTLEVK